MSMYRRRRDAFDKSIRITRVSPQPVVEGTYFDVYGENFGEELSGGNGSVLWLADAPKWEDTVITQDLTPGPESDWSNTQIHAFGTNLWNFNSEGWLYILRNDMTWSESFYVTLQVV